MAKKAKFLKHSNGEKFNVSICCQQKKNQIDKVVKPSNTSELIDVDQAVGIHLQEEIIMDILSKLPVSSLVRFKSVSRFWNTLFSDPYFKIKHLSHAKNNSSSQKFLVTQWSTDYKDRFKLYSSSLSSLHLAEDVHKPDFPANGRLLCLLMYCCCDGLVLLAVADAFNEHLLLWNPSTRESILLPHPESPLKDYICTMEYDTTNDDYMILMINFNARVHGLGPYRYSYSYRNLHEISFEFLALKSGSWRKIGKYPTDIKRVAGCSWDRCIDSLAFVHGAYHWVGWSQGYIVVTFSISNEVYGKMPLVEKMCNFNVKSFIERGVSVLGGMLCFYSTYTHGEKGTFKLWVMKDYGVKESWTELFTICDTDLISAKPKYWFADGEVLLCCRYSGHVGRVFRTSKGPFGIWSQCHTSLNGIIYTESSISPKLLI